MSYNLVRAMDNWEDVKKQLYKITGRHIPEEYMCQERPFSGYTDATRHLAWLYNHKFTGNFNIPALQAQHDMRWLFGPYAHVLYKALLARRLADANTD